MREIVRKALYATVALLSGFCVGSFATLSAPTYYDIPTVETIRKPNNISDNIGLRKQKTVALSRNSAVRIYSMSDNLVTVSSSSGTYLKFHGKYYILTTAHGILGDCELIRIDVGDELRDCKRYAEINRLVDYAIIEVDKIDSRDPIRIPAILPRGLRWTETFSVLNTTYYTGFPNNSGPLTLSGEVAGYTPSDFLILRSYAWAGSSGSGVFSEDGLFIGFVLAVEVGETQHGLSVIEDIVIVVPSFKVNWALLANSDK